jgi:hypothetical protein
VGDGRRPALLGFATLSGGVRLTETAREAHRWVGVAWGGGPCAAETPTCTVLRGGAVELSTNLGSSPTHDPQHSRYTPRCPSVVLWTPCSRGEQRAAGWFRVEQPATQMYRYI